MIPFQPCQYVVAFFAAVSTLSSVAFANTTSVHERMTAEEVQQIFQTTHDSVPDYDVVQVEISRLVKHGSRSTRGMKLIAFDEKKINLTLWLHPTDGILAGKDTPVKIVRKNARGLLFYEDYPDAMRNVGTLLEDPETKASVVVKRDSRGRHSVNGYVASKNLVIRSLPESISDNLLKYSLTQNSDSSNDSKTTRSAYHVVFGREVKHAEKSNKSVGVNEKKSKQSRTPTVPIPPIVYPEVMVVVDWTFMSINNNSIDNILAYVVTFWNGVDLMYRSFESPKFRFNIARVVIATKKADLPFIRYNDIDNKSDAHSILKHMQRYYYSVAKDLPLDSYDAVVAMTGLDMTDSSKTVFVIGTSQQYGACTVKNVRKLVLKTAIVTDHGSFGAVSVAAHEFAHLLGSGHDEKEQGCPPEDGYVMTSTLKNTENSHDFSSCTMSDIQRFLSRNRGHCLYNIPKSTNPLPRVLPGKFRDRDYQCQSIGYGRSCYIDGVPDQCTGAIYCNEPKEPHICKRLDRHYPADGAFCSAGMVCLHGKCLAL